MNGKRLALVVMLALAAAILGWSWGWGSGRAGPSNAEHAAHAPGQSKLGSKPLPKPAAAGSSTQREIPTGDPLERYRAAKTTKERVDIMGQFMTLGHPRNVNMLMDAVNDPDAKVRMDAVQYAASMLEADVARDVYRISALSVDPAIREMTWSFLAPQAVENRVAVYGEVLVKGSDAAFEEVLSEMGRTPEMPFFETMLMRAQQTGVNAARAQRILSELNNWLKPGGGNVPNFNSLADVQFWWLANKKNYDTFLLRVD